MEFIGNYRSIIPEGLINYLMSNTGQPRPKNISAEIINTEDTYLKGIRAGYDLSKTFWHIFEKHDINLDIIPSWVSGDVHWWITKMLPGDIMPMHTDPPTLKNTCNRFWMPLQDYQHGHVFIINNQLITNYSQGDVFKFTNSQDYHGAANIGYTPRLMLQVTELLS